MRIGQIGTIVALWVTFTAGPSEAQVPEPPPAALVDARLVNDLLLDAMDADGIVNLSRVDADSPDENPYK